MKTVEFLKAMEETAKDQENHNDFYELAEKYGFCTPWCVCEECNEYSSLTI
jgi:hypothetical protein